MRPNIYRLLEHPTIYAASQWCLLPGSSALLRRPYRQWFGDATGCVLDVGCGPQPSTPVGHARMVGVDINADYIRSYANTVDASVAVLDDQTSQRRRFGFVASAEHLPFSDGYFDESRCFGLFHHLPATVARAAATEMVRCVKPGGIISIIDNVWPHSPWHRPAAWLIRRLDRGEWVRSEQELSELTSAISGTWSQQRITYTLNGLELLILQARKLPSPNGELKVEPTFA
ncbi:MAG: hypothetical protein RL701_2255 [Pseudomonadota bacterium]|jgi:SAM-dependent methyltransferase